MKLANHTFQIRVDEKKMKQWRDWDVHDGYTFSVYGLFILIFQCKVVSQFLTTHK